MFTLADLFFERRQAITLFDWLALVFSSNIVALTVMGELGAERSRGVDQGRVSERLRAGVVQMHFLLL